MQQGVPHICGISCCCIHMRLPIGIDGLVTIVGVTAACSKPQVGPEV